MECPYCRKEITGKKCVACGTELPSQARFCMECGVMVSGEGAGPAAAADQDEGLDLEDRVLCPDGTCTGIIVEGRCTECGRPYPAQGPSGQ
jgi:hypothetical protein